MNKPIPAIASDDEFGPLDEHGQQVWTPGEAAAVARMEADPAFWEGIREAEADIAAGRVYTTEEMSTHLDEVRRRYLAERAR